MVKWYRLGRSARVWKWRRASMITLRTSSTRTTAYPTAGLWLESMAGTSPSSRTLTSSSSRTTWRPSSSWIAPRWPSWRTFERSSSPTVRATSIPSSSARTHNCSNAEVWQAYDFLVFSSILCLYYRSNCSPCLFAASKLMSNVNSLFASAYVYYWPRFFKNRELHYPPSFDARVVLYPTDKNLRDYLAWRQADVHINNLYNTCFWSLVLKKHLTPQQVIERLDMALQKYNKWMLIDALYLF